MHTIKAYVDVELLLGALLQHVDSTATECAWDHMHGSAAWNIVLDLQQQYICRVIM